MAMNFISKHVDSLKKKLTRATRRGTEAVWRLLVCGLKSLMKYVVDMNTTWD